MQLCPVVVQGYVPKALELRVTVVAEQVFAVAIDSQRSARTRYDWRHYDQRTTPMWAHELPSAVADRCRNLVGQLGLDLRRHRPHRHSRRRVRVPRARTPTASACGPSTRAVCRSRSGGDDARWCGPSPRCGPSARRGAACGRSRHERRPRVSSPRWPTALDQASSPADARAGVARPAGAVTPKRSLGLTVDVEPYDGSPSYHVSVQAPDGPRGRLRGWPRRLAVAAARGRPLHRTRPAPRGRPGPAGRRGHRLPRPRLVRRAADRAAGRLEPGPAGRRRMRADARLRTSYRRAVDAFRRAKGLHDRRGHRGVARRQRAGARRPGRAGPGQCPRGRSCAAPMVAEASAAGAGRTRPSGWSTCTSRGPNRPTRRLRRPSPPIPPASSRRPQRAQHRDCALAGRGRP